MAAAHNISQTKRRDAALRLTLGELQGWLLLAGCRDCRVRRYLPLAALAGRYGAEHRLGMVLPRLRCRACGIEPSTLHLMNRREGSAGPLHGVILFGPGAF